MHYKLHLLVNRFNPFRLLHKLPFQKKKYMELGIDIDKEVNSAFSNKNFGLSILVAGGVLIAFVFLLLFSILNFSISLLNIDFIITNFIFISLGVISFLCCHILVFRNDRYLQYFEEFSKWDKVKTIRNVVVSAFIIITAIILFFLSLF